MKNQSIFVVQIVTLESNFKNQVEAADGVDGKDFFKHVRTRLSYESFNSFLASIKKLNSHQNTREETLAEAKNIFGLKDTDLYSQFEKLLSRHV